MFFFQPDTQSCTISHFSSALFVICVKSLFPHRYCSGGGGGFCRTSLEGVWFLPTNFTSLSLQLRLLMSGSLDNFPSAHPVLGHGVPRQHQHHSSGDRVCFSPAPTPVSSPPPPPHTHPAAVAVFPFLSTGTGLFSFLLLLSVTCLDRAFLLLANHSAPVILGDLANCHFSFSNISWSHSQSDTLCFSTCPVYFLCLF